MLTRPPAALAVRDVPQLPAVRAGNVPDAKALRTRLQTLLQGLERADEVLLRLVAQAQAHHIHLVLEDEHGTFFRDWTSFCTAPIPWGLGISQTLVDELAREHRDPARRARMALDAPLILRYRGGQPGHAPTQPAALSAPGRPLPNPTPRAPGTVEYQLQRLKRDHPQILQQLAEGKIRSVAAAAELAGFRPVKLRVLKTPTAIARAIVCEFPPEAVAEIVELVQHPERIPAPPGPKGASWRRYEASLQGSALPPQLTPPTGASS